MMMPMTMRDTSLSLAYLLQLMSGLEVRAPQHRKQLCRNTMLAGSIPLPILEDTAHNNGTCTNILAQSMQSMHADKAHKVHWERRNLYWAYQRDRRRPHRPKAQHLVVMKRAT
jgi:hypothetical protein